MKKINDWFMAGLIAGIVGGMGLVIFNFSIVLLGIPTGTYWKAVGGLFYNKELMKHWLAQLHGVIDALGVSGANGILLALTIKKTGTDYLYPKSVVLSALAAYFLFTAIYPQTGLGKDNPYTPWVALFGHTVFNGVLAGYVLQKICRFTKQPVHESAIQQKANTATINRPASRVISLRPKVLPGVEFGESLCPVPEFERPLIRVPDCGEELTPRPGLKYRPGMKKVHFIKPKKLNRRKN